MSAHRETEKERIKNILENARNEAKQWKENFDALQELANNFKQTGKDTVIEILNTNDVDQTLIDEIIKKLEALKTNVTTELEKKPDTEDIVWLKKQKILTKIDIFVVILLIFFSNIFFIFLLSFYSWFFGHTLTCIII